MNSRLYSIIISGYKETSAATLTEVLALKRSGDVSLEVIFLDNTRDGRHADMARAQFASAPADLRTVYLHHAEPGKAAAQNQGLAEARGQFFVFLDDDVLPDPDLILAYDRGFQTHTCGAIQGRVALKFEGGARAPSWLNERFRLDLAEMDFGKPILPFEMGLTGANMAFRAELFKKYGTFDERLGPGRSGTLEDQEFSERIRSRGEVQLFWPAASVQHRIPPARLRVRSFAGIYFDVGFSDFFLSGHHIKGGRLRFTLYTLKQILRLQPRLFASALRGCTADMLHAYCECWRACGYWCQGMRQIRGGKVPTCSA